MKGNRTGIEFENHELHVVQNDEVLIYHLKKPGTYWNSIKYINTQGIMAVTGDYGNWIFCREFHPSADGFVSDGYWCEKLSISSTQVYNEYDSETTLKEIQRQLNVGLVEQGYEGEELEVMTEYLEECLSYVDDELDYTQYAYHNMPSFMDAENVIFKSEIKPWLKTIFDGFDEICRRLKESEDQTQPLDETNV